MNHGHVMMVPAEDVQAGAARSYFLTGSDHMHVVTVGAEQMQMLAAIMRARDVLPMISGLGFLISPLVVGLLAGASVSVWRALKDEPALDIAV